MLQEIHGQATWVLSDKDTGEVISEGTQNNIITESLYTKLVGTYQFGFNIVVTNTVMESSRFTNLFPGNGTAGVVTIFPSTFIPSLGVYSRWVDSDGVNPGYVQFGGRYSAPAIGATRTVTSIGLGVTMGVNFSNPTTTPQTNNLHLVVNAGDPARPMAFLKLTTPCIQTDTQVLDIYYRLFFPHTPSTENLPKFVYEALPFNYTNNPGTSPTGSFNSTIYPFKLPKAKAGDEALTLLPYASIWSWVGTANSFAFRTWTTGTFGNAFYNYTDTNFTDNPGLMIASQTNATTPNPATNPANQYVAAYYQNLPRSSKIQNLIGIGTESTNPLAVPFLDVDNLPTGTGKVYLGGSWNNVGAPSSPGLYYSSRLPEYVRIKITTAGAVGVSQYKIVRQKFFGYVPRSTSFLFDNTTSNYYYQQRAIPALCAGGVSSNGTTTYYDYGKCLIEDITETFFSVQQLSSCCRFDDSSMIFVKKNKLILYSIGAGDYWKINGSYTDIHQVAVVNNKIYAACRNTGLWVIDPYNSLTPVSLASPGGGIDLSICNGVAKGNGNTVWAVANNCLASYDGTTWTRYDSTTAPAFTMAGVSDGNWGNIEYLKVDEDSATNQMLLVRKWNATVNSNLLGVWWSTAGVTTNTGAETVPTSPNMGRPRVHRGHVGGLGGYWLVLIQRQWNRMTFGSSSFTSVSSVAAYPTPSGSGFNALSDNSWWRSLYQSATFVKNTSGTVLSWHSDAVSTSKMSTNTIGQGWTQNAQELVNSSGTVIDSLTTTNSGMITTSSYFQLGVNNGGLQSMSGRTSSQGSYGGQFDMSHNFVLCPGVMITVCYPVTNVNSSGVTQSSTNPASVVTQITNFGLDYTQTGGSMAYVAQEEYGWNGSQWVLNATGGRPTHLTTEQLFDGVTVRFEEGASGTSFQTPNMYKFGLCEGLLKDNATRATYTGTTFYLRKTTYGVTDLDNSTVPDARAGQTGVIGIDVENTSSGALLNLANEVIFPGQNVRQYAMGNKPLVGDFIISIDVTNLNATDIKNASAFGVTRQDWGNSGLMAFGFYCFAGTLYWYDQGAASTTGSIATISAGTTTSLEIRRVGSTITLWRNGSSVKTMAGTGIRAGDLCLDFIRGTWDTQDITYLPNTGTRTPAATITSNGTAIYVDMGNSTTNTGRFSSRFYGIDYITPGTSTVTMDGTSITPKTDGTAPLAGQITVDVVRGTMYFNSADIGKSITANYMVVNS